MLSDTEAETLARDPIAQVRAAAAGSRSIAEDSDETLASQARAQLERPRHFTGFLRDIDLTT